MVDNTWSPEQELGPAQQANHPAGNAQNMFTSPITLFYDHCSTFIVPHSGTRTDGREYWPRNMGWNAGKFRSKTRWRAQADALIKHAWRRRRWWRQSYRSNSRPLNKLRLPSARTNPAAVMACIECCRFIAVRKNVQTYWSESIMVSSCHIQLGLWPAVR